MPFQKLLLAAHRRAGAKWQQRAAAAPAIADLIELCFKRLPKDAIEYFRGGAGDEIVAFTEKPVESFSVSMGVYAVSTAALTSYEAGAALGFDELVIDLLRTGPSPRAHPFDGYWLDIGRPDDYDSANEEWDELRHRLLPPTT